MIFWILRYNSVHTPIEIVTHVSRIVLQLIALKFINWLVSFLYNVVEHEFLRRLVQVVRLNSQALSDSDFFSEVTHKAL